MYKYVLTTVITPVTLLLCIHRFHTAHRHIPARLNHPVNICHPSSINALHTPCTRVLLYSVVHYHLPLLIGASASENYRGEFNGSHATIDTSDHLSLDMGDILEPVVCLHASDIDRDYTQNILKFSNQGHIYG